MPKATASSFYNKRRCTAVGVESEALQAQGSTISKDFTYLLITP